MDWKQKHVILIFKKNDDDEGNFRFQMLKIYCTFVGD